MAGSGIQFTALLGSVVGSASVSTSGLTVASASVFTAGSAVEALVPVLVSLSAAGSATGVAGAFGAGVADLTPDLTTGVGVGSCSLAGVLAAGSVDSGSGATVVFEAAGTSASGALVSGVSVSGALVSGILAAGAGDSSTGAAGVEFSTLAGAGVVVFKVAVAAGWALAVASTC